MKTHSIFAACAVLALAIPVRGGAQAGGRDAPPPYRISLQAMLFYSDRGTFSPDLIAHPVSLFNTVIGEGSAGGASKATLVVAVVSGEAGSYDPTRRVELTVTSGGREVFKRAEDTSVMSRDGRTYVGFWLYGTGCRRLQLSARILGQTPSTPVTATLPFLCGE